MKTYGQRKRGCPKSHFLIFAAPLLCQNNFKNEHPAPLLIVKRDVFRFIFGLQSLGVTLFGQPLLFFVALSLRR
jgi:hypothetical protein